MPNTCKYYKQKKQVSYDNGQTWEDVTPAEYRKGSVYEYNSSDCGGSSAIYQWVNMDISTDFYCDGTIKHYKQKKQVSYDNGQTWEDVTPAEYQIGERCNSCSECKSSTIISQWKTMDISTDFYCVDTTKYYKQQQQVSYDDGQIWTPTENYRIGELYEVNSIACGGVITKTRWVNMNISTDFYCDGTTKYYKQKKQVSYDDGQTWEDVTPAEYRKGSVYEYNSSDCGYVPPVFNDKFKATYLDERTYILACDGSSTLTMENTSPSGYLSTSMISAVIGNCVTTIGEYALSDCIALKSITIPNSVTTISNRAFEGCSNLPSITIPNSVTTIGNRAFYNCHSLTSVNIPRGVTSIDNHAFYRCHSLTSITCNATTPPSLGNFALDDTNDCPIYVPSGSVMTYKTNEYWSVYYLRIQAIA